LHALQPGPQWPEKPPPRSHAPAFLAFAVLVVLVSLVAVVAFLGFGHDWNDAPKAWDPQVAPIATQVAALRGLQFKHPVKVNYLTPEEFAKKVTSSPQELKDQEKAYAQQAALLRAAGLLGANVNLGDAVNASQDADVVAFYSFDTKQVYIRGTGPLTVETRVILAHELTHVLQDQYFDIGKLRKAADKSTTGSSDALAALIEGDAERIKAKYLDALPKSEQQEYDKLFRNTSDQATQQAKGVPAVVEFVSGAPYIFGPPIVSVIDEVGGNRAVDAALRGPPPSTSMYFDPSAVNDTVDPPPAPKVQAGEKLVPLFQGDTSFDAFQLYLMLSARVDAADALRAIDGFAAGSSIVYEKGGAVCFRAAVRGRDQGASDYVRSLLDRWAKGMPGAAVESSSSVVVFHGCDPARHTPAPNDTAITQGVTLAAARDGFVQGIVQNNIPGREAVCFSRVLFQRPDVRLAVLANRPLDHPSDQMLAEGRAARQECDSNVNAGRS
jgi:hypothetical protein